MRDRVFGGCRVSSPSVPCLAGERNAREGQRRRAEVFSQRDREKEQGRNKFSWDRRNRDGECSSIVTFAESCGGVVIRVMCTL